MARFRYSNRLLLYPIMFGLPFLCLQCGYPSYTGTAALSEHPWLAHKKIFWIATAATASRERDPTACPSRC